VIVTIILSIVERESSMQAVGRADNSPGSEKLRVGAEERRTREEEEEEKEEEEGGDVDLREDLEEAEDSLPANFL
jgi:hypothetical protein